MLIDYDLIICRCIFLINNDFIFEDAFFDLIFKIMFFYYSFYIQHLSYYSSIFMPYVWTNNWRKDRISDFLEVEFIHIFNQI